MLAAALLGAAVAAPGWADERVPVVVTPGSERSYRVAVQRFAEATAPDVARLDDAQVAAFRETLLSVGRQNSHSVGSSSMPTTATSCGMRSPRRSHSSITTRAR